MARLTGEGGRLNASVLQRVRFRGWNFNDELPTRQNTRTRTRTRYSETSQA